jgi:hypothetical protein
MDSMCMTRSAAPRRRHSELSTCCALAADVPAHRAKSSNGARGGADGLPSRRRGSAPLRRERSDLDRLVRWRTLRPVSWKKKRAAHRGVAGRPRWNGEGETQTRTRGKSFPRPHIGLLLVARISLNPAFRVTDEEIDGLCVLRATYPFQHHMRRHHNGD